jgi:hypothetical protein
MQAFGDPDTAGVDADQHRAGGIDVGPHGFGQR